MFVLNSCTSVRYVYVISMIILISDDPPTGYDEGVKRGSQSNSVPQQQSTITNPILVSECKWITPYYAQSIRPAQPALSVTNPVVKLFCKLNLFVGSQVRHDGRMAHACT